MKNFLKTVLMIAVVVLISTQVHAADDKGFTGRKAFGFGGLGNYSLSNYESLYLNFATSGLKTAGMGFETFFEFGLAKDFTMSVDVGFERLLYANKFKTQMKLNYFLLDVLGRYYFRAVDRTVQPFLAGGVGVIASSIGAAPTLDLGGGSHFMLTDNVSLWVQLLYKTAIIHHRGEGALGIAYHF